MRYVSTLLLVVWCACAAAEHVSVPFHPCPDVSAEACTVHAVRIEPCAEAPRPCRVTRGSDAAVSFDFTPNFAAASLQTAVYWARGGLAEPQLPGMDPDGCHYAACPAAAGARNQFNFQLHLGKKLPKATYPIKWKVWNKDDPAQVCCYITRIELVAQKRGARTSKAL